MIEKIFELVKNQGPNEGYWEPVAIMIICILISMAIQIIFSRYKFRKQYLDHPFFDFYKAMIDTYRENEPMKGDSWRTTHWSYLMDNLLKQIEDMNCDPDREDYFANIGNYSAMIWINEREISARYMMNGSRSGCVIK